MANKRYLDEDGLMEYHELLMSNVGGSSDNLPAKINVIVENINRTTGEVRLIFKFYDKAYKRIPYNPEVIVKQNQNELTNYTPSASEDINGYLPYPDDDKYSTLGIKITIYTALFKLDQDITLDVIFYDESDSSKIIDVVTVVVTPTTPQAS